MSQSLRAGEPGPAAACLAGCDLDGRLATAADLRVGDVFEWAGGSWYGVGTVTDTYVSREASGDGSRYWHRPALMCIRASAPVINPPALDYVAADRPVVIYARHRGEETRA